MPTYQYRCQACRNELEVFQKFTDDSLTTCQECGGSLRKLFSPVGIVFKGSGFYATDSRKSKTASVANSGSSSSEGAQTESSSSQGSKSNGSGSAEATSASSTTSGSKAKDGAAA